MKPSSSSKLGQFMAAADALDGSARPLARSARRHLKPKAPKSRGGTIRPGTDTPRWLALVAAIRPHLHGYGAKSLLARELGLPPARIHEFFISRTALPDAERTLLLLEWLRRRQSSAATES
jgi:hypothetical protein